MLRHLQLMPLLQVEAAVLYPGMRPTVSSISVYYAPESDIRVKSLDNLNFSRSTIVQFRESQYIIGLNQTSESKIIVVGICLALWCLIWRISIYYVLESDIRVRTDDLSNFSRASVVQFQASRYIMRLNRTSEWKVMTISIFREFSLFNFEHLYIVGA